ncbi:MAG: 2-amino-4-hydroxy-6-hydroxymethyldihydropteridine diphosphokinase [Candidatus Marinimicrobia bacterium]|nr:2-amino-4-hydroxy-6-hydroxymethyldihydropteridine diphosphokinase [Candidatus Neomarinimicrobiota bacterium]
MTRCLISIGSNQNEPQLQIKSAFEQLDQIYEQVELSELYLTEPVGQVKQETFLNAAISLETKSTPQQLLKQLLDIECLAGRNRDSEIPKGPRNLDLDIILFGNEILQSESLIIPHPRYRERRFVLAPLSTIAPEHVDPVSQKSISQLLFECPDTSWVKPLINEPLVV